MNFPPGHNLSILIQFNIFWGTVLHWVVGGCDYVKLASVSLNPGEGKVQWRQSGGGTWLSWEWRVPGGGADCVTRPLGKPYWKLTLSCKLQAALGHALVRRLGSVPGPCSLPYPHRARVAATS